MSVSPVKTQGITGISPIILGILRAISGDVKNEVFAPLGGR
jgi:hypothetical protein